MSFVVKKAVREKLKGAIAMIGPSGSGKTLSALFTAYGLMKAKYPDLEDEQVWEKIGFLDTEHKRALIYANLTKAGVKIGSFLHLDFPKPYTVERYIQGFDALKEAGAEVIIADSLSHAWEGDGGLLELQQNMGGKFQDWIKTNPFYQKFVSLVTGELHDVHVINCVRTKQDYQVSLGETGKLKVEKLGLKPVQRDSLEYEFQIVFNINMNHIAEVSKDNSGIFEGKPLQITPEVGKLIYAWLEEGKDVKAEEEKTKQKFIKLIEQYRTEESVILAGYIDELEEQTRKVKGHGFEGLPPERLQKLVTLIQDKKEELAKQPPVEEAPKDEGITYWIHEESGNLFTLVPNEGRPAAGCVELTKEEYDRELAKQHAGA